jgi:hypothetical protein
VLTLIGPLAVALDSGAYLVVDPGTFDKWRLQLQLGLGLGAAW